MPHTPDSPPFPPRFGARPREADPWERVEDREELLVRARLLTQAPPGDLTPEDEAFLLFTFRASDPPLYQAAALALGRHLARSPHLRDYLTGYASHLGVPLSGPMMPAGRRAHRRVLLARVAMEGEGGGVAALPDLSPPGRPGEESPGMGLSPRDRGAILVALDFLLAHGEGGEEAVAYALPFLHPANTEGAVGDRALLGHLARIVAALALAGHEGEARGCWFRLLLELGREGEAEGAGAVLSHLLRADELARAAALATRGGGSRWAPPPGLPSTLAAFLDARMEEWRDIGEESGDGGTELLRNELVEILRDLSDPSEWARPPAFRRGLRFFRVVDPALRLRLSPGALQEMAVAGRLVAPRGASGKDLLSLDPVKGPALTRFLEVERDGALALDPTLLHRLEMEALFRLLQDGGVRRAPHLLPSMADALEHRFRFSLAHDPVFDPFAFLASLEASVPGGRVLEEMADLAAGREYRYPDGRPFPLESHLRQAVVEMGGGGSEPNLADLEPDPHRRELREALVRGEGPLLDEVVHLGALFSKLLPGQFRRMARSGRRAGLRDAARWSRRLGTALERVDLVVGGETPGRTISPRALSGALQDAGSALGSAERELYPHLPPAERRLLAHRVRTLEERIWREGAALARLSGSWGEGEPARRVGALREVEDANLRRLLLLEAWRVSAAEVGVGDGEGEGSGTSDLASHARWRRAVELLGQGGELGAEFFATADDAQAWGEAMARGWGTLVRHGLERGHPRRLARLIRDPRLLPMAATQENAHLLVELRGWFLDVHRPIDAAAVTRVMKGWARTGEEGGRWDPVELVERTATLAAALPATLRALVVRHAALWLALLVGAILMLDFGDAWKAMAEVGDVLGIAITAVLGLTGAFAYLLFDLRRRIGPAPEDFAGVTAMGDVGRALLFLLATTVYTLALTTGLWLLLSGTDEVVHGTGAPLHIAAWAGFSLFAGVFFGLLAKGN